MKHLQDKPLYLVDVTTAQLEKSRDKLCAAEQARLIPIRMNAENLGFQNNSFMTVLIFFLMHEMPEDARHKAFNEALRVLAPGGQLVITEYGAEPRSHWIYRFWPLRKLLLKYEPFLNGFWCEDIVETLTTKANALDKNIKLIEEHKIFNQFYRVLVFQLQ